MGPNNSIVVAKLSNVTGVRRGLKLANPMDADEHDGSDDDSSSDEEDDGKEGRTTSSKVPVLQVTDGLAHFFPEFCGITKSEAIRVYRNQVGEAMVLN